MKKKKKDKVQAIYLALIEALAYAIACVAFDEMRRALEFDLKLVAKHAGLTAIPAHAAHEDRFGAIRRLLLALADAIECDDMDEELYDPLEETSLQLRLDCETRNPLPEGQYEARLLRFHADNCTAALPTTQN
jgi:hypothetical protein